MFTSETPSWRTVVRSSCAHSRASAALRRSGSVTISTSGVPPRLKSTSDAPEPWMRPDSPTWISFAASSSRWTRWMRTSPSRPPLRQRDVVLADLVALRQVGVEVVLAVEDRARRDLALERRGDHQRVADRLLVGHRQRPGMAEADRAGVDVRLVAERQRAAAEHLRPRRELDVDLEPDHGLVAVGDRRSSVAAGGRASKPIARSSAYAASRIAFSLNAGPAIWKPTGSSGPPPSGSASPAGIEIAGMPGERHRHREVVVAGTSPAGRRASPRARRRPRARSA